ncbi:MAG TPA: hypothetical protein VGE20_00485 [Ramlibacter sp.]
MSSLAYYLISLGVALVLIAVASGLIALQLRRGQRRLQAMALLDALARSTDWVAAQGRAVCFQAVTDQNDPSLDEVRTLQRQWFPELEVPADELFDVHGRLAELLRMHERLRADDPEAWLDGAYDAAFMTLWREHCAIAQTMERQLVAVARATDAPRQHTFPA